MDELLKGLAEASKALPVKFYAYLDDHDNLVATGTQTTLPYSKLIEIDEEGHKLCLERGVDVLELRDNKIALREIKVSKLNRLIYFDKKFDRASVIVRINGAEVTAELTPLGLAELATYEKKGMAQCKIWILDSELRHRCIASLKVGTDNPICTAQLDYQPTSIVAAAYPLFNSFSLEIM